MVKIPEGWIETTLGKCGNIITGKTPSTSNLDFRGGNTPFITPTDINESQRFCNPERNISDYGVDSFSSIIVPKNTICYTSIASIGLMCLTKQDSLTNQQINSLIVDENNDYLFFYYYLKYITPSIIKNAGGTTVPIINKSDFSKISVIVPQNPQEQKAIAGVLSAFDDKIELLRAENQTLEEMGQTLFKEWFISPLAPGRGNGTAKNTSDPKKEKSPLGDLGAELPDGWKEYELSELVDTVNGYSYKGDELVEKSNEALVTLKSFDRNGGFQTRGFKEFKGNPKSEQEVFIGDLVVAHTDLTQDAEVLGNPAFIVNNGGFERLYITMDLVKVNSKNENITKSFLYFLMRTKEFKGHCVGYSNGTTVLHLSKKAIPEYKIVLPKDLSGLKEKSLAFELIMKKISHNFSQIDELIKARDQLLPKLMSGEVRVEF